MSSRPPILILGAGPAGLGVSLRLARRGFPVTLVDRAETVGGNAGSFDLDGFHADYGSHRLHPSCAPEILADIRTLLGGDLLDRPRHGRIHLGGAGRTSSFKAADLPCALRVAGVRFCARRALKLFRAGLAESRLYCCEDQAGDLLQFTSLRRAKFGAGSGSARC
jgi:monoamine oxidase